MWLSQPAAFIDSDGLTIITADYQCREFGSNKQQLMECIECISEAKAYRHGK